MCIIEPVKAFRLSSKFIGILIITGVILATTSIYAESVKDRIVFTSERMSNGRGNDLFLVDGLQGKPVQLSAELRPRIHDPSFSPDGKEVVFISFPNIARMDIATRQVEFLTNNRDSNTIYSNLDWSYDGSSIAFLMSTDADQIIMNICIMDIESRDIRQLTDSPGIKSRPSWSPDSSKIVYAEQDLQSHFHDLYVVDKEGKEVVNITQTSDTDELFPFWLTDNRIAFMSFTQSSSVFDVFIMNMDGSERRKSDLSIELSTRGSGIRGWVWSPDGTQILLSRQIRPDDSAPHMRQLKIYLIDVANGTKNLWMEDGSAPDWVKPGRVE